MLINLKPSPNDEDAMAHEVNVFAMYTPWVITHAIYIINEFSETE